MGGGKNGEDESVLLQKPIATTDATIDSPVGEYAILISGGEAQNYSFKYVDGILTIIEASGIEEIVDSEQPITVYTLLGKKIKVPSLKLLHRGIYIVNGHKFVKNR